MAKIVYITERELEELNSKILSTGVKKECVAKLLDCSMTYLSLMLTGRKGININKMPLINNILDRYIALFKELSEKDGESKKEVRDRVSEKYSDTIALLDTLDDYSKVNNIFEDIEEGYLKEKLEITLEFALDNNLDIEKLGGSLKTVIYCYG
tara:strand:- start:595 stop:1053 length:459 start_codon:yes stop_codon:yes gene_type:complete